MMVLKNNAVTTRDTRPHKCSRILLTLHRSITLSSIVVWVIAISSSYSQNPAPIAGNDPEIGIVEHLGDIVNRGIWAEMLGDRKFYYEVNSSQDEPKPLPAMTTPGPALNAATI